MIFMQILYMGQNHLHGGIKGGIKRMYVYARFMRFVILSWSAKLCHKYARATAIMGELKGV